MWASSEFIHQMYIYLMKQKSHFPFTKTTPTPISFRESSFSICSWQLIC
jgi:hypothetical protein